MRDYDVFELKTAAELDTAFARTFGLPDTLNWAQAYDTNAVTDFLEGLTGERRIWDWTIHFRNWGDGEFPYECIVDSVHYWAGRKLGLKRYGFGDTACHAMMRAAVEWDQQRRAQKRDKVAAKRAALPSGSN